MSFLSKYIQCKRCLKLIAMNPSESEIRLAFKNGDSVGYGNDSFFEKNNEMCGCSTAQRNFTKAKIEKV